MNLLIESFCSSYYFTLYVFFIYFLLYSRSFFVLLFNFNSVYLYSIILYRKFNNVLNEYYLLLNIIHSFNLLLQYNQ
ncbi:hypothetical protein BCR32DRAFT_148867 [Anaeromyces robustus]|uniref:Uncharacterized protein n=1 Tax=Anaeromyces robustus TaxID=1754192 RepID=A0A1Y1XCN0_9FUNG|nr:hypothetical protein BCR32DRAFT_148867 [Anaeromyces robustus]|eukprot:ORX83473.1 hypothetical protein BCR32DRAFT_148867 [Anaeromyces robustus]